LKTVILEIQNPIYTKILQGITLLRPALEIESYFWKRTQYRRMRTVYKKCFIKKGGLIFTGWLPRIKTFCKDRRIKLIIESTEVNDLLEKGIPKPKDFTFPDFQLEDLQIKLVEEGIRTKRGILVAPTAVGKTAIAISLMKAFESLKMLFIVPNITLVDQTVSELERFGFKNIVAVTKGEKKITGKIVVSNIQTLEKIDLIKYTDYFGLTIIDEAHLAMADGATCESIMSRLLSPIRIGLTATLPTEIEKMLVLEGIIGPVIERISYDEAIDDNLIVPPKIKLITLSEIHFDGRMKYAEIYDKGIVENQERNEKIIAEANLFAKRNETSIIFVRKISHGETLLKMAQKIGLNVFYVSGDTEREVRDLVKKQISQKKLDLIISTVVFATGVNIPSLSAIFLAAGGESQISVIQSVGRGLRKSDGKTYGVIYDCLDRGKYLSDHAISRISIYRELGWI
jgi:superfamily II DNA or RNA helicase